MKRRNFLKLGSSALYAGIACPWLQHHVWAEQKGFQIIEPQASDEVLVNPGMGFETFHSFNSDERNTRWEHYPQCSIAYFRFYWSRLEPQEGKYNFDEIEELLDKARQNGQDLALRFMPMSTTNARQGTPMWYRDKAKVYDFERGGGRGWAPDHNSSYFLAKQEELITAFGQRYNGHPHVIRMEIGSVGFWGEWHLSHTKPEVPMITEENACKVIDMYLEHWDRTPLAMLIGYVPGLRYAVSKGTGWRADSLGDYGHWSDTWCHMFNAYPQKLEQGRAIDAWKNGPIAFEPPGSMRDLDRYVPTKVGGYDNMWDQALAWHGSAYNAKSGEIPAHQTPSIERFLKRCGYRFVLKRVTLPQDLPGGQRECPLSLTIMNTGVAPVYRDCILAVKLDGNGRSVILKSKSEVSQWLPGAHTVDENLALPGPLSTGTYLASIAILEPTDLRPVVKFAHGNRQADGWLPLARIEVAVGG
jgi:hypothetical protein